MEQPSPKKTITDGPVVPPSNNTSITQGETGANVGEPEAETSSVHMQIGDHAVKDDSAGCNDKDGGNDSYGSRTTAYLKQVWKDDLNSGQVVMSLFELFGEGIRSFIPAPEMSLFL